LSNFTRELNKKPAISDEDESVAKMGFNLDGFVDVAKCMVDADSAFVKNITNIYFKIKFITLTFESIYLYSTLFLPFSFAL